MKKITFVILIVFMSTLLTGCFNKAADAPGVWYIPWTWGNQPLEVSLAKECAQGARQVTIEDNIYDCPGQTTIPESTTPPANTLVIDWDPCTQGSNPELQIEALVENSEVVPNAFMGLDLNQFEVDKGMKYSLNLGPDAYAHFFNAHDGLTRDAKGPGLFESTAYTVWCQAGDYRAEIAGQHQIMDAKNLPAHLSPDPQPLPFSITP